MNVTAEKTDDGMVYTFSMPPIRIVDVSNFPEIVVEWDGTLVKGLVLNRDMVQFGNVILVRPREE